MYWDTLVQVCQIDLDLVQWQRLYRWKSDLELRIATCLAEALQSVLQLMVFFPESLQVSGTPFAQLPGSTVVGVHRLRDVVVNDSVVLLHWRRM